jgi:hypothetical protein
MWFNDDSARAGQRMEGPSGARAIFGFRRQLARYLTAPELDRIFTYYNYEVGYFQNNAKGGIFQLTYISGNVVKRVLA